MLYEKPSLNSDALDQIIKGSILMVDYTMEGDWAYAIVKDMKGWILKLSARQKSRSPKARSPKRSAITKLNRVISCSPKQYLESDISEINIIDEPPKRGLRVVHSVAIDNKRQEKFKSTLGQQLRECLYRKE